MSKKSTASVHPTSAHDGERVLERLRKLCLSMPRAVEKISHGEPTWFTGENGKVFAMFDNHHHGASHIGVWVPTPPEIQEFLVSSDPQTYFVPPYVGKKGWTGVVLDTAPDWKVVEDLVQTAFASASKGTPSLPPRASTRPPASSRNAPPPASSRNTRPSASRASKPPPRASLKPPRTR
ncbi:MAG TPA: MmcQ/YjbR family DNA-binding protein [Polyangiaceae bacterium]|nr:MmcQ/YjbR family DNA-binding protein [Polyangiaceae bacterium]